FLNPDFHREQRRLAIRTQRTGFRHAEPDLDRLLVLRDGRCCRHRGKCSCGRSHRIHGGFHITQHTVLPKLLWFCGFFSPIDLPTPVARPIRWEGPTSSITNLSSSPPPPPPQEGGLVS